MLPAQRRNVGDKLVRDDFAARAQFVGGAAEIDGVPEDDGGDGEIEAGGVLRPLGSGSHGRFRVKWSGSSAHQKTPVAVSVSKV
jgi:hypothetical protein